MQKAFKDIGKLSVAPERVLSLALMGYADANHGLAEEVIKEFREEVEAFRVLIKEKLNDADRALFENYLGKLESFKKLNTRIDIGRDKIYTNISNNGFLKNTYKKFFNNHEFIKACQNSWKELIGDPYFPEGTLEGKTRLYWRMVKYLSQEDREIIQDELFARVKVKLTNSSRDMDWEADIYVASWDDLKENEKMAFLRRKPEFLELFFRINQEMYLDSYGWEGEDHSPSVKRKGNILEQFFKATTLSAKERVKAYVDFTGAIQKMPNVPKKFQVEKLHRIIEKEAIDKLPQTLREEFTALIGYGHITRESMMKLKNNSQAFKRFGEIVLSDEWVNALDSAIYQTSQNVEIMAKFENNEL